MMAMPIWDRMVTARLLVKASGIKARTRANRLQTTQRPRLSGLNS